MQPMTYDVPRHRTADEPQPRPLTYRDGDRFWREWEADLAWLQECIEAMPANPESMDGRY